MNIFILLALVLGASAHRGHSAPKPKACCRGYTAQCMACVAGITIEEFCQSRYRSAHKGREYPGCKSVLKTEVELSALDTLEALLARGAPKPEGCCRAYTAQCMACVAGITKEEFCESRYFKRVLKGRVPGCKSVLKTEVELSALDTLEALLARGAYKPRCCRADTAQCFACVAGITKEEFCESRYRSAHKGREYPGCKGVLKTEVELSALDTLRTGCCSGLTVNCLACSAGMTEERYCAENLHFPGCPTEVEPPRGCCSGLTVNCLACSAGITEERYCAINPHFRDCRRKQYDHLQALLARHKQRTEVELQRSVDPYSRIAGPLEDPCRIAAGTLQRNADNSFFGVQITPNISECRRIKDKFCPLWPDNSHCADWTGLVKEGFCARNPDNSHCANWTGLVGFLQERFCAKNPNSSHCTPQAEVELSALDTLESPLARRRFVFKVKPKPKLRRCCNGGRCYSCSEVELSALDTLESPLARTYCDENPNTSRCIKQKERYCKRNRFQMRFSKTLGAYCTGMTEERYCAENPDNFDCKTEVELSAVDLLFFSRRYCAENPHFPDCKTEVELSAVDHLEVPLASILHKQKKRCCNGNTARCSACKAGVSKKVYCDAMKRFAFMGTIKGC